MATALDTNIFIYAHFSEFPEHRATRAFLETLLKKPDPFFLSWQVYYEYLRLVTHPQVLRIPLSIAEAAKDLHVYWKDPRCHLLVETDRHESTVTALLHELPSARGNFLHDCHYAALLKEHAVDTIVTVDTDFKKFDFLTVVNPLI